MLLKRGSVHEDISAEILRTEKHTGKGGGVEQNPQTADSFQETEVCVVGVEKEEERGSRSGPGCFGVGVGCKCSSQTVQHPMRPQDFLICQGR